MRELSITAANIAEPIILGRQGETGVQRLTFHLADFFSDVPENGSLSLITTLPDGQTFSQMLSIKKFFADLVITSVYTATAGQGELQLSLQAGEKIEKSAPIAFLVRSAVTLPN